MGGYEGLDGPPAPAVPWLNDVIIHNLAQHCRHLGTVREMVVRSFRELEQAELIAFDRHQIRVLDEAGLQELI